MASTITIIILLVLAFASTDTSSYQPSSAKICGKIRDGKLKILAMGTRGYNDPHNHKFYLLAEKGYLFTLPFHNLVLDPDNKVQNKLLIDKPYQNASELYNKTKSYFTAYSQYSGKNFTSFFLISQSDNYHYLGKVTEPSSSQMCYQLYYLDAIIKLRRNPQPKCQELTKHVSSVGATQFVMSIESQTSTEHPKAFAFTMKQVENGWNAVWKYTLKADKRSLSVEEPNGGWAVSVPLSRDYKDIIAAFYYHLPSAVDQEHMMVFLTRNGTLAIIEKDQNNAFSRAVELPLSDFIECDPESYLILILALSGVALVFLAICAYYGFKWARKRKRRQNEEEEESPEEAKKKKKKQRRDKKRVKRTTPSDSYVVSLVSSSII